MQENKDYIIKCPSSLKGLNNKVKSRQERNVLRYGTLFCNG